MIATDDDDDDDNKLPVKKPCRVTPWMKFLHNFVTIEGKTGWEIVLVH